MEFLAFVGSNGPQPEENRARMAREFPAYQAELRQRRVKLLGRPLDIDERPATVRVRGGDTLVADDPFVETKEFVGGLDVLACADLEEAVEVESKSPVVRFLPFEIRPFRGGARRGTGLPAFSAGDDTAGAPYLFLAWVEGRPEHADVAPEYPRWQEELDAQGSYVIGGPLGPPEQATTLRFRDGAVRPSDGPFLDVDGFITCVDVVSCADRQQALAYAAGHPLARTCAVELRPFHSEASGTRPQAASTS